jgi:hypothetical protein
MASFQSRICPRLARPKLLVIEDVLVIRDNIALHYIYIAGLDIERFVCLLCGSPLLGG